MSNERRKQYEVRTHIAEALYQRMLREAAATGERLSEIVRTALAEAFAARDVTAEAVRFLPADTDAPRRVPLPLLELEARIAARIDDHTDTLASIDLRIARAEAMLDRLYFGLMLHMPEVPPELRATRSQSASARHRAWLTAVDEHAARTSDAFAPAAAPAVNGGSGERQPRK